MWRLLLNVFAKSTRWELCAVQKNVCHKLFWTNYEDKRTVISHSDTHSVFVLWEGRGGAGGNHSGLGCWRCFLRWRTKKYTLTEWPGTRPLNTDQWNVTIGPYCLYCLHREIVKPTKMLSFLLSDCSNIVHSIISSLAAACRSCSGKAGGGGGPTYQPYAWFLNTVFSYQEIYYISATTWPNFSQDLQHF